MRGDAMPSRIKTMPFGDAGRARKTREILYDGNDDDDPATVEEDAAINNNKEDEHNDILLSCRQIASDLIDAMCHAILRLGSQKEKDEECIPPFKSYLTLMQRLDYYIDDFCRQSSGRPLDKKSIVHRRLLMARVIIDICSRRTYPCLPPHSDAGLDKRLALIDAPTSFWQDQCAKLRELRFGPDITDGNGQYEAIDCQMVALEALSELRAELIRAEAISNTEGENVAAQKLVDDVINDYFTKTSAIDKRLKKVGMTHYADLFVPENTLFVNDGEADDDSSPTDGIEGMIQHRVFPLKNLQIEILRLFRFWESEYLTPPALYANDYFKHDEVALPSNKAVALPSKKSSVTLPSKRSRAPSPPRKAKTTTTLKFDSDNAETLSDDYSPAPRSKKMKGKGKVRVPYSDKEKKMLMDGVEAFGVGQWAKILEHYDFTENNRTSVNLKDLYRTLTKKANKGLND